MKNSPEERSGISDDQWCAGTIFQLFLLIEKKNPCHLEMIFPCMYKKQKFREKSIFFKQQYGRFAPVASRKFVLMVKIVRIFFPQGEIGGNGFIFPQNINKLNAIKKNEPDRINYRRGFSTPY